MSSIAAGLDIPTIITWITTVAIPAAVAIFAGWKAGGLKGALKAAAEEFVNYDKLMTQEEPMTKEQEALITSGKVSDRTWKMSDETFRQMCETLERYEVLVNHQELRDLVTFAEKGNNVDYGILITDKDGNVDRTAKTHIYVSYGTPMYVSYEVAKHNAEVGNSPLYYIPVWWYLTDLRKNLVLSEMQLTAKTSECVDRAIEQIREAEESQVETYTLTCKPHYWIISRGKIIERGAGGEK